MSRCEGKLHYRAENADGVVDRRRNRNAVSTSALGHKRTLGMVRLMSALPPKADMPEFEEHVRFVPKADIPLSASVYAVRISPIENNQAPAAIRKMLARRAIKRPIEVTRSK